MTDSHRETPASIYAALILNTRDSAIPGKSSVAFQNVNRPSSYKCIPDIDLSGSGVCGSKSITHQRFPGQLSFAIVISPAFAMDAAFHGCCRRLLFRFRSHFPSHFRIWYSNNGKRRITCLRRSDRWQWDSSTGPNLGASIIFAAGSTTQAASG